MMLGGRAYIATVALVSLGTIGMGIFVFAMLAPHIAINTTPSAPYGAYWLTALTGEHTLQVGERVMIDPPQWVKDALRQIAPDYDTTRMWMKTIVAVPGDNVCLEGTTVTINGEKRAERPLLKDYTLDVPEGCATVGPHTYFVMNDHPHSFDSRYVGNINKVSIKGMLSPLWTWTEHDTQTP